MSEKTRMEREWMEQVNRIAELEAENARLGMELNSDGRFVLLRRERDDYKGKFEIMKADWVALMRERDEARAQRDALTDTDGLPLHSRDLNEARAALRELGEKLEAHVENHAATERHLFDARAACAVMRGALDGCFELGPASRKAYDAALSSTAGAELLKEHEQTRKDLDFTVADRDHLHAQRDELLARLEALTMVKRENEERFQSVIDAELSANRELSARLENMEGYPDMDRVALIRECETRQREIEGLQSSNADLQARLEKAEAAAKDATAELTVWKNSADAISKHRESYRNQLKGAHKGIRTAAEDLADTKDYYEEKLEAMTAHAQKMEQSARAHGVAERNALQRMEQAQAERNQLREELRLEKRDSDEFALSAGAQLAMTQRAEKAERLVKGKELVAVMDAMTENLELKAQLELESKAAEFHGKLCAEQGAQLEALRSALERLLANPHDSCPMCDSGVLRKQVVERGDDHWPDCQYVTARAALSPSAPRLYRNQVLEEAASRAHSGKPVMICGCAGNIRALKDKESGT